MNPELTGSDSSEESVLIPDSSTSEEISPSPEELENERIMVEKHQQFNKEFTEVLIKYREVVPLAYMAKLCFSTAVDLITNQSAVQTQYIVQQMLAPLFQGQGQAEEAPSRIIIPR